MWVVYVLLCQDSSLYTGITVDLKKRFIEHKNGLGGKYTRSHKVVHILYSEPAKSHSAALKKEMLIKSWSRKQKIKNLNLNLNQSI